MLSSTDEIAATLRLLVPGFILMKTFYQFGLQTKRSDAQWAVWSILAAAAVNALAVRVVGALGQGWADAFVMALLLAVIGGLGLAFVWRKWVSRLPQVGTVGAIRAWDDLFVSFGSRSRWVQIQTIHSGVISGPTLYAAKSVDTDELDIYVIDPKLVELGGYVDLPAVEGVLVQRSEIASLAVFASKPPQHEVAASSAGASRST